MVREAIEAEVRPLFNEAKIGGGYRLAVARVHPRPYSDQHIHTKSHTPCFQVAFIARGPSTTRPHLPLPR